MSAPPTRAQKKTWRRRCHRARWSLNRWRDEYEGVVIRFVGPDLVSTEIVAPWLRSPVQQTPPAPSPTVPGCT